MDWDDVDAVLSYVEGYLSGADQEQASRLVLEQRKHIISDFLASEAGLRASEQKWTDVEMSRYAESTSVPSDRSRAECGRRRPSE